MGVFRTIVGGGPFFPVGKKVFPADSLDINLRDLQSAKSNTHVKLSFTKGYLIWHNKKMGNQIMEQTRCPIDNYS